MVEPSNTLPLVMSSGLPTPIAVRYAVNGLRRSLGVDTVLGDLWSLPQIKLAITASRVKLESGKEKLLTPCD